MNRTYYKIEAIGVDGVYLATLENIEKCTNNNDNKFMDRLFEKFNNYCETYVNEKCVAIELIKCKKVNGETLYRIIDKKYR